jgi:hypothetical protein
VKRDILPKVIDNKQLTGRMLLNLAIEFTNAMNTG